MNNIPDKLDLQNSHKQQQQWPQRQPHLMTQQTVITQLQKVKKSKQQKVQMLQNQMNYIPDRLDLQNSHKQQQQWPQRQPHSMTQQALTTLLQKVKKSKLQKVQMIQSQMNYIPDKLELQYYQKLQLH